MAKKLTLSDYEKRVEKAETDLQKLYEEEKKLAQSYQEQKAILTDKIATQKKKLNDAKNQRNLCLLEESDREYQALKDFILGRDVGGGHHV